MKFKKFDTENIIKILTIAFIGLIYTVLFAKIMFF